MKKTIVLILFFVALLLLTGYAYKSRVEKKVERIETSQKYDFVGQKVKPFEIKDMKGTVLSESVFKDQKLTMTVFWSPNCLPCIEELEALDKVYAQEKALDFKMMSICVDGQAKDIQNLKGNYKMAYPIVVLKDDPFMKDCTKDFEFIPFVIFVDKNGTYLKEYLVGSRTYEEYMTHIKELLRKIS